MISRTSPRLLGRVIALLFLLTLITGVFAQAFVSDRLYVSNDAAATATNFFNVAGANNTIMAGRFRRMMQAADVARLGCRGLTAGRRVVITGVMNKLLALAGRFAPHRISLPVTDLMMSGE